MTKPQRAYALAGLLLILFIGGISAKLCPLAERTITVPAVVGGPEGGLLHIRITTQPGSGSALTSITPLVGLSTQASQAEAVQEAFRGLDLSPDSCEIHFYIEDAGESPSVDGPSAGMAMTVALRAALTNRTLRSDVSITGAILEGGQAGLVGGIIDKAQASARGGMHAILTPRQELYENILLERLGQERNFSAVEVKDLDEAMAIATSPADQPISSRYSLQNRPVPTGLGALEMDEGDRRFAQVSERLNDMLEARLRAGGLFAQDGYGDYFQAEIENNRRLAGMGYGYTAANNAFLTQVDAAFLSLPAHAPDVEGEADQVLRCIRKAPAVNLTTENFEWVAGGSARIAWAMQKVEDIKRSSGEATSSEEQYLALREVYYAQAWCDAGTQLLEIGREVGGTPTGGSKLEELARQQVQTQGERLRQAGVEDGDAYWHYQIANRSLTRQEWAAALFDSAYVAGTLDAVRAAEENQTLNGTDLRQALQGVWARQYASQARYLQTGHEDEALASDTQHVWSMALAMQERMEAGRDAARRGGSGLASVSDMSGALSGTDKSDPYKLDAAGVLAAGAVLLAILILGVGIGRAIERRKKSGRRSR